MVAHSTHHSFSTHNTYSSLLWNDDASDDSVLHISACSHCWNRHPSASLSLLQTANVKETLTLRTHQSVAGL